MDQEFDRKVARCRLQPIVRGAVLTALFQIDSRDHEPQSNSTSVSNHKVGQRQSGQPLGREQ